MKQRRRATVLLGELSESLTSDGIFKGQTVLSCAAVSICASPH